MHALAMITMSWVNGIHVDLFFKWNVMKYHIYKYIRMAFEINVLVLKLCKELELIGVIIAIFTLLQITLPQKS